MERQSPRVILRNPRRGRFGEDEVLVLEMGLGGAKFEHGFRLDVGRAATFTCGPLTTEGAVRHSVLLPAKTGVVYQSGVAFTSLGDRERELLLELLVHEAEQQVSEWEANMRGDVPPRAKKPPRVSAVAVRFVTLRLVNQRWQRTTSKDPNQPVDGITILETTPDAEVAILKRSYESADNATRDFMRQVAILAILEQMRVP
ncbi:MAG TPA: hypothetical protein VM733_00795 [Thermoanaerobaculia bacterium]|nr:hypothetical protein [Thermoanaerobaculia bacterium]